MNSAKGQHLPYQQPVITCLVVSCSNRLGSTSKLVLVTRNIEKNSLIVIRMLPKQLMHLPRCFPAVIMFIPFNADAVRYSSSICKSDASVSKINGSMESAKTVATDDCCKCFSEWQIIPPFLWSSKGVHDFIKPMKYNRHCNVLLFNKCKTSSNALTQWMIIGFPYSLATLSACWNNIPANDNRYQKFIESALSNRYHVGFMQSRF